MDWKDVVGKLLGYVAPGEKTRYWSLVFTAVAFAGGFAMGKWACQGKGAIVTTVEKIPVPASSGRQVVPATPIERGVAKEPDEARRGSRGTPAANRHAAQRPAVERRNPPAVSDILPIDYVEVGEQEILQGMALFPDSALGRVDTVMVTSYGAPVFRMDIRLHRGRGEIADPDTVRVPAPIIDGVEPEWVGIIGLLMFIAGALAL